MHTLLSSHFNRSPRKLTKCRIPQDILFCDKRRDRRNTVCLSRERLKVQGQTDKEDGASYLKQKGGMIVDFIMQGDYDENEIMEKINSSSSGTGFIGVFNACRSRTVRIVGCTCNTAE